MGKDMLTGHPPRGSAHTNRKDWNAMTLYIYRATSRRTLFRFACRGGLNTHTAEHSMIQVQGRAWMRLVLVVTGERLPSVPDWRHLARNFFLVEPSSEPQVPPVRAYLTGPTEALMPGH